MNRKKMKNAKIGVPKIIAKFLLIFLHHSESKMNKFSIELCGKKAR